MWSFLCSPIINALTYLLTYFTFSFPGTKPFCQRECSKHYELSFFIQFYSSWRFTDLITFHLVFLCRFLIKVPWVIVLITYGCNMTKTLWLAGLYTCWLIASCHLLPEPIFSGMLRLHCKIRCCHGMSSVCNAGLLWRNCK